MFSHGVLGGVWEGNLQIGIVLGICIHHLQCPTTVYKWDTEGGPRGEEGWGDCVIQKSALTVWYHQHFSIFRCLWYVSQSSRFWRKKANWWRSDPSPALPGRYTAGDQRLHAQKWPSPVYAKLSETEGPGEPSVKRSLHIFIVYKEEASAASVVHE